MKWKSIDGYEGYYEVSNCGKVRSVDRVIMNTTKNGKPRPCKIKGRVLKTHTRKDGRLQVALSIEGKLSTQSVHVLVANAFMPNKNKTLEINHIDGEHKNNNVSNLEWVNRDVNIKHAFSNRLYSTMKKVALLDVNGNIEKVYPSESSACRDIGMAQGKISRAIRRNGTCNNRKWMFVDEGVTTTEKWTSPTE